MFNSLPEKDLNSTTTHTNVQTKRLTQETLTSLHGAVLLHLKLEQAEDSGAYDKELHLSDVATDTSTRTVTKWDECGLLTGAETLGGPALGNKFLGISTPDLLRAVDGVAGHREDITGIEGVSADHDRSSASGNLAGKTHGRRAMDAHGFPNDVLEAEGCQFVVVIIQCSGTY
jgi:hypothetical protein